MTPKHPRDFVDTVVRNSQKSRQLEGGISTAGQGASWAPFWGAVTANPTLGADGTLAGRVTRVGRQVTASLLLKFGTLTLPGTGLWYFTLPATPNVAQVNWLGQWWAVAASGAVTTGVCAATSSVVTMPIGGGTTNYIGPANPFTWNSGCQLGVQVTFESTS